MPRKAPGRSRGATRRVGPAGTLAAPGDGNASSARSAILEAAVQALEHKGESTIRISEIARKAGVAVGLIYYHFTDREGLVSAAQVERMLRLPLDDINLIDAAVRLHENADHFTQMVAKILCAAVGAERASTRLDRVAILGASKGRATYTASLGRAIADETDRLASIIENAKGKGMVDPRVDSRAFATLAQAISVGMVVSDLDAKPVDRRQLLDVYLRSFVGFMGPKAKLPAVEAAPVERKRSRRAPSRNGR